MNCERCGESPGEIRYTEYTGGQARKLMICKRCAEDLGFGPLESADPPATASPGAPSAPDAPPDAAAVTGPVPPAIPVFGSIDIQVAITEGIPPRPRDDRQCPGCGLRVHELESLLGCPRCYETFADSLEPLFERLHGATRHRGRLPGGRIVEPEEGTP